jgi:hypothetical protein
MSNIEEFTATCHEPYDRHTYLVVFKGDQPNIMCDSWEEAYSIWFRWNGMKSIDRIDVCDIVKKNVPLGFK